MRKWKLVGGGGEITFVAYGRRVEFKKAVIITPSWLFNHS